MGIENKKTLTKTRRYQRGVDQVHEDIANPRHLEQYMETKDADELPGLGKHYCLECAKWFDTEYNLVDHRKGKPHKRRVKQLQEEPYSQKEAEAAAGFYSAPIAKKTEATGSTDVEMS